MLFNNQGDCPCSAPDAGRLDCFHWLWITVMRNRIFQIVLGSLGVVETLREHTVFRSFLFVLNGTKDGHSMAITE